MKRHIMFGLGLLFVSTLSVHCMDVQPTVLDKPKQKEFREVLAGYRAAYTYQQLLARTGKNENKAESRLRRKWEASLERYKTVYSNDPFVKQAFTKLDKFKSKEVPAMFEKLAEPKK